MKTDSMRYMIILSLLLSCESKPINREVTKEVVLRKEQVNEIDKDYTMKYWEATTEFYIVTEGREVIEVSKEQFLSLQTGDTIEVYNGRLVTTTKMQWSR